MKEKIFTVREITRLVKDLIEKEIGNLWVCGEISNFKAHSSGHFYFSLKDEYSQLSCVMFRDDTRNLKFKPEDGMEVNAYGMVSVYEKQGKYQLYVYGMKPVGLGELSQRFEALKKKLKSEGLFDEDHKKPIPEFPLKIGVVTARTGAAIQDIMNILTRRAPYVEVILKSVKVQGEESAEEIAKAIHEFNEYKNVDLLIVGRGGGSIEDLWSFNEERVARSIYRSQIPIISAVGHEIDFTISDFVADLRAPTPSAAAELAVRDKKELLETIHHFTITIGRSLSDLIGKNVEKLTNLTKRYGIVRVIDRIRQQKQLIDDLNRRISSRINFLFKTRFQTGDSLSKRLLSLDPKSVLSRGYAIIHKLPSMEIITRQKEINLFDRLGIEFSDGISRAVVDKKDVSKEGEKSQDDTEEDMFG
jgi:exodeoxyribonuclease VII large subunit